MPWLFKSLSPVDYASEAIVLVEDAIALIDSMLHEEADLRAVTPLNRDKARLEAALANLREVTDPDCAPLTLDETD